MKNDAVFMEHLLTFIHENLANESFDVRALARGIRYSRTQTFRKIKHLTGLPPSAFIAEQRLLRAQKMLLETDLTIAQIGYATGFKDAGYFSRAFKRRFGETAGAVRGTRK